MGGLRTNQGETSEKQATYKVGNEKPGGWSILQSENCLNRYLLRSYAGIGWQRIHLEGMTAVSGRHVLRQTIMRGVKTRSRKERRLTFPMALGPNQSCSMLSRLGRTRLWYTEDEVNLVSLDWSQSCSAVAISYARSAIGID